MSRTTLFVIVEGQTEDAVLRTLLRETLGALEIDLHCPLIQTGHGRGGIKSLRFDEFRDQILRHLKDRRTPYVSTFFDYYAFPQGTKKGWEFVEEAKAQRSIRGIEFTVKNIETEISRRVVINSVIQGANQRFIPYIQLHELEALFFAEPAKMAEVFVQPALSEKFTKIVSEKGGCEAIDDSPVTAPSKRIEQLFPKYKKGRTDAAHGPRLAGKMNLNAVRQACPRFNKWLEQIESLAPSRS
jgi:hypothetical protein